MLSVQLSERAVAVQPSPTASLNARCADLRACGNEIIGMGSGELDFDTPIHIRNAAKQAIDAGHTRYTPTDGILELKKAVVRKFRRDNELDYDVDQVLVTCGCKQALYNLAQSTLNVGDEVIISAPFWVSYPEIVKLAGGKPVIVKTAIEQGFKMTPKQLQQAITPNTRLIILNSPGNPTGCQYSRAELAELGQVIIRHPRVMVVSDDIYEHMIWSGIGFSNIVNACPDLYSRCIVVNGVSKAYAMTGWRIGFAAGPRLIIDKMKAIQSQSTSNASSVSQYAALAALDGDQTFIREVVAALRRRHDFVYHELSAMRGIRCCAAQGTFYIFPDVQAAMARKGFATDHAFCEYLIESAGIAVVPGSVFGAPGHVRLSYATEMISLEKAMACMAQAVQ